MKKQSIFLDYNDINYFRLESLSCVYYDHYHPSYIPEEEYMSCDEIYSLIFFSSLGEKLFYLAVHGSSEDFLLLEDKKKLLTSSVLQEYINLSSDKVNIVLSQHYECLDFYLFHHLTSVYIYKSEKSNMLFFFIN